MSKFFLGSTSEKRLATIHPVGQEIVRAAIADPDCPCDIGVVKGWCGEAEQNGYYAAGTSNARWGESDHNFLKGNKPCALAFDLGAYRDGNYVWDQEDPIHEVVASHLMTVANRLGYKLEWGGNYKIGPSKQPDKFHYSLRF